MQRFRVDLKTFLGFFGKKSQTLTIPIYSTIVLYDYL